MKVYRNISDFKNVKQPVITIGTFDGVHRGHKKILTHLKNRADECGGESVLLTFYPHPRMVLQPDSEVKMLSSMREKENLLSEIGIHHLVVHPFTKEFSRTTSLEFVRDLLVNEMSVSRLVIGYDHHFGRNREGGFEFLSELAGTYGFEVEEIPAFEVDDVNVSSTKIRKALAENGDVRSAAKFLGYRYAITGTVEEGQKLGRKIGYKTANIKPETEVKLIPADGVYVVKCMVGSEEYGGMLNIGEKPTVSDTGERSVEVHLFDFDRDIYGEEITVRFIDRIRSEQKFKDKHKLKSALDKDKQKALAVLEDII